MPTRLAHHPELFATLRAPTVAEPWRVLVSGCIAGLPCGVDATDYGMGGSLAAVLGLPTVQAHPFFPEDHGLGTPRTIRAGVPVVSQRDFATLARLRLLAEPAYRPEDGLLDHHQHPWVIEHFGLARG